jgi:hypothetical protein
MQGIANMTYLFIILNVNKRNSEERAGVIIYGNQNVGMRTMSCKSYTRVTKWFRVLEPWLNNGLGLLLKE